MANSIQTAGTSVNSADLDSLITLDTDAFTYSTQTLKDGFTWHKTTNFSPVDIISRSGPLLVFAHSGPITVNLSFLLAAMTDGQAEVEQVAIALHGLLYPTQPGVKPPPIVRFTKKGHRLFNDWDCVCTDISIQEAGPYAQDGTSMVSTVTMQLTELCTENLASSKFAKGGKVTQQYV